MPDVVQRFLVPVKKLRGKVSAVGFRAVLTIHSSGKNTKQPIATSDAQKNTRNPTVFETSFSLPFQSVGIAHLAQIDNAETGQSTAQIVPTVAALPMFQFLNAVAYTSMDRVGRGAGRPAP